MDEEKKQAARDFRKSINFFGVVFVTFCLIANYVPAIYVSSTLGFFPSASEMFNIWLAAAAAFGVGWFVQPISFFPIIGVAGSYIVYISGNLGELRAPASFMAQKVTNVEPGTPQAELMSCLGICGSVFVSVTMVSIFALAGTYLLPLMPPFIMSGLKYVLPAVIGAAYANISENKVALSLVIMVAALAGKVIFPKIGIPGGCLMLVNIFVAVLIARGYYKFVLKN